MSNATREQRRQLFEQLIGNEVDDKYRITGLLGFGGMGAVYEAVQSPMDRLVALKLIPTYDPTAAARFEREAYTVSKLAHPNTVTVFDFGQTDDGHLYLSMEHLQGTTLTELIRNEGPLEAKRVVHIAQQVCRSLGEAHRQGIIHRDVKPDNIFLIEVDGDPDYVKVLDFGIAKAVHGEDDVSLTAEGRIIGTPRYMSPEQILAKSVDHRSDLYSLGCIIFEMVCGTPPFDQQSTAALMMNHAQKAPPTFSERLDPDQLGRIPAGLESLVRRIMAKNPESRPQTTDDMRRELERALRINQAYEAHTQADATQNVLPPHSGDHTGPQPNIEDRTSQTGGFDQFTGDFSRQTGDFSQQQLNSQTDVGSKTERDIDIDLAHGEDRSNKRLVAAILIMLLFLIAGTVFLFMSEETDNDTTSGDAAAIAANDDEQTGAPSPDEAPADKATDKAPSPADADKAPIEETVLITSPTGATVFLDTPDGFKKLGQTPYPLTLEPEGPPATYRFELKGYRSTALTIDPGQARPQYTRALDKRAEQPEEKDEKVERKTPRRTKRTRPPRRKRPRPSDEKAVRTVDEASEEEAASAKDPEPEDSDSSGTVSVPTLDEEPPNIDVQRLDD